MMRKTITFLIVFVIGLIPYSNSASFVAAENNDIDDYDLVLSRIQDQLESGINLSKIEADIANYLLSYNANGSFSDVDYAAIDRTNWPPMEHNYRLYDFAFAYTMPGSTHYQDEAMYSKIVAGLEYWYTRNPHCSNWWYNQVGEPQYLGRILIQMRKGKQQIPAALESKTLERMRTDGGNPASQTGANKTDIALHWMYRACLTKDATLLSTALTQAYQPLQILNSGEGIRIDYSYLQHGNQFYIIGYGDELIKGITMFSDFFTGTAYALTDPVKVNIFDKLVRENFYKVIRGRFAHFNVLGRGMSREGATSKGGTSRFARSMQQLVLSDTEKVTEYDNIIKRLTETEAADYGVKPNNTTYFVGDYAIHTRPGYSFGVRTVSTRTIRSEYGNGENLKTYFLSDGSTSIAVNGNEYEKIFPVWDWAKIPGTTAPAFSTIPLAASDMSTPGTSTFTGGVSDSLYSANTYTYIDTYSGKDKNGLQLPAINVSAKKSWFFFDQEVVCLGAGINSTNDLEIHTTVNQCLLNGDIITVNNTLTPSPPLGKGTHSFDTETVKAVVHNSIAYIFPEKTNIDLLAQEQSGSWYDINTTQKTDVVKHDVFTLSINHGIKPQGDTYAYIVVPNKQPANIVSYATNDLPKIEILANTDSVQVVRHTGLNICQMIFFKAASFTHGDISVQAEQACALLFKNLGTSEVLLHVADPGQTRRMIKLGVNIPSVSSETKQVSCDFTATGNYAGQTRVYTINASLLAYTPVEIQEESPVLEEYSSVATEDAWVWDSSANRGTNYGSAKYLTVKKDNAGYERSAYFKFSIADLEHVIDNPDYDNRVIVSLCLLRTNNTARNSSWILHPVDDSWSESTITYNNAPQPTGTVVGETSGKQINPTVIGYNSDNIVEIDITNYAISEYEKGNKTISLFLTNPVREASGGHDVDFASKENEETKAHPKLIIRAYEPKEESDITVTNYDELVTALAGTEEKIIVDGIITFPSDPATPTTNTLKVKRSLNIEGTPGSALDGQGHTQIMTIGDGLAGINVTIDNLIFQNGFILNNAGAAIMAAGDLNDTWLIRNCVFDSNKANGTNANGGAISTWKNSANTTVRFVNCTFVNNDTKAGASSPSPASTGAVNVDKGATVYIYNSLFHNNIAKSGDAVDLRRAGNAGGLHVYNSYTTTGTFAYGTINTNTANNTSQSAAVLFADAANGKYYPPADYTLKDDKCYTAGLSFPEKDIAGSKRIVGTIGVGPYEEIESSTFTLNAGTNVTSAGTFTEATYSYGAPATVTGITTSGASYIMEPLEGVVFSGTAPNFEAAITAVLPNLELTFNAKNPTNIPLVDKGDKVSVYINDSGILTIVNGQIGDKVQIFDMLGSKLHEEILNARLSTINCQLKAGVYLVKTGNETVKVVAK